MLPVQPPFHWVVGADGRIIVQCGEADGLPPLNLVRGVQTVVDLRLSCLQLNVIKMHARSGACRGSLSQGERLKTREQNW